MASAIVIFRTIDTDHSDSITIEEFKAYWDVSFAAMFDHHCFAEAALLVSLSIPSISWTCRAPPVRGWQEGEGGHEAAAAR